MLRNLEAKLGGLVEGAFGRAFKTSVQPVELAHKLAKEMEDNQMASVSRVYVPNHYRVFLSEKDREQFASYEPALRKELSDYLLEHARQVGMIKEPAFPADVDAWTRELRDLKAVACAPQLAPRPLLVIHGSDDDLVPVFDARVLVDAHGDAELRIMNGAGHRVRHDPRAIAVLLGWLDRVSQRRVPA